MCCKCSCVKVFNGRSVTSETSCSLIFCLYGYINIIIRRLYFFFRSWDINTYTFLLPTVHYTTEIWFYDEVMLNEKQCHCKARKAFMRYCQTMWRSDLTHDMNRIQHVSLVEFVKKRMKSISNGIFFQNVITLHWLR